MSISERCSCGATFDTVPGLEFEKASAFADRWRKNHKHDMPQPEAGGSSVRAMGFPLPEPEDDDFE